MDFFRDLGPLARIITGKPEAKNRFYTANQKVITNQRDNPTVEEIHLLALNGNLAWTQISPLENDIVKMETQESDDSDKGEDGEENGCFWVNATGGWSPNSSLQEFESSYGEESDYVTAE